jgi:hypothetical protein
VAGVAGLFWLHATMLPASKAPRAIFVIIEAEVFIVLICFTAIYAKNLLVLIYKNFDKDKLSAQVS